MSRKEKFAYIAKILDRYEKISGRAIYNRFDRFIDLDVSNVDVKALSESDNETLFHDCNGIFNNLERDRDDPEKSVLKMFVPRVGFMKLQ